MIGGACRAWASPGADLYAAAQRVMLRLGRYTPRARALRERYDSGQYRNLDELGATDDITGGRASQLMNLLLLAPGIIAALDVPMERASRLSEREFRKIARMFEHEDQRVVFGRMVRAVGAPSCRIATP